MSKRCAWPVLAALMLLFSPRPAAAQSSEPLKPYVVLILDTSGSMDAATGSGPPSCGGVDNRLNHAKCAINRIVNSYGDMVFALSRFRETPSGTFASSCDANGDIDGGGNDDCGTSGVNCEPCNCDGSDTTCDASNCTSDMRSDSRLQMLTGLVDGNNQLAAALTDNACSTCALPATGTAPTTTNEIWGAGSWTPLGGALLGSHRYWQGLQATDGTTMWPAAAGALGGFDPIRNDPTKTAFLPAGCDTSPTCTTNCCASQCRPYITILLTDGAETCGGDAEIAATNLLNGTVIDGRRYRIETKPIGFGIAAGNADIEEIATNGSLSPDPLGNDGYYANDEAGLQLAISQILDDAIRTEVCNGVDDDCDNTADEGFTTGTTCANNRLGVCRVVGTTGCRADGAGTQCSAGREPECASAVNGTACSVANAASAQVAGTCQAGVCNPTAAGTPGSASNEVPFGCNGLDDDCDGKVDENVTGCACIPTTEVCDGDDDDCDGQIDEGTTIPCGTGTCLGTRACVGGMLQACSAQTPTTETCNGIDDNCDGNADGFTQACSNLSNGFPPLDALNNPGAAGHTPASGCEALGTACICRPGSRSCPLNGGGTYSTCTGEVTPQLEICNGLDDDCDGQIDEAPPVTCTTDTQCATTPLTPTCDNPSGLAGQGTCVPADCSSNCGVGQLICVGGMQQCDAVAAPTDDTCNGVDDDCDGDQDEDWRCADPDGADGILGNADDCPCTAQGQCGGIEQCQNGAVVCAGEPLAAESCNCRDDNCNGQVDEGNLCGPGATCTDCQCAFECTPGEFPCPAGKYCVTGYCLADPCFGVTCPAVPGDQQECRPQVANPAAHECISSCSTQQCPSPNICFLPTGECRPDDCSTFPDRCTTDQNCINGACVQDLCKDVTCGAGENCVAGTCTGSCADIDCPTGQRCRLGACQADPCDPPCAFGQACQDDTATCVSDPCTTVQCPSGQWCNPNNHGACEDDPCVIYDVECGAGEVCKGGTCFDAQDFVSDAGVDVYVTAAGGGGCNAGAGGDAGGLALLGLGLVHLVRRRRVGGAA